MIPKKLRGLENFTTFRSVTAWSRIDESVLLRDHAKTSAGKHFQNVFFQLRNFIYKQNRSESCFHFSFFLTKRT